MFFFFRLVMVQKDDSTEIPEGTVREKAISEEPVENDSQDEEDANSVDKNERHDKKEKDEDSKEDGDSGRDEDTDHYDEADKKDNEEGKEERKPHLSKSISTESLHNEENENKQSQNGDTEGPYYIHVKNLKRPFTLASLQTLLKKYGEFNVDTDFWIDSIRSHCIVRVCFLFFGKRLLNLNNFSMLHQRKRIRL